MTPIHPSMKLSALEQSGPRGYIRPLFFFSLDSSTLEYDAILKVLRDALELTKRAIPMLSAELVRDIDSQQKGLFKLVPSDTAGTLHSKDLRGGKFQFAYKDLKKMDFPSSALPQETFCPLPIFPGEGSKIPVFAAQSTVIDGGLVLNVCIMHLVADARAIYEIFKVWAQNCRHLQDPKETPSREQIPVSFFEKEIFTQKSGTQGSATNCGGLAPQHPNYEVYNSPPPPPPAMLISSFRTQVFRFSSSNLVQLKRDAAVGLEDGEWISTTDAVCALIWRCVLAAQIDLDNLAQDTSSLNTICVDGRGRCSDPLPESHIGCPMVYATPEIGVHQILGSDGISKAASAIRSAVTAIDKHSIAALVKFLSEVPSYDCIAPTSFGSLMHTGTMMSSWFQVPFYEINWGEMFDHGHCERVRAVHEGFFNGSQLVMPELPGGGMEVIIGLDESNWGKFKEDELWKRYTS